MNGFPLTGYECIATLISVSAVVVWLVLFFSG